MKLAISLRSFLPGLLAASLLALVGCSDPPNISGTCAVADDCDDDLTCNTAVAGGYCTVACTVSGSTDECPDDSICDTVAGAALSCVKICKAAADCRTDLDCNGVSGSNIKACKPKV